MLKKYLTVFLVSMLPIVELRGGIPIGAGLGLGFRESYLICVLGNLLPVPFLIPFSKILLEWLSTWPVVGPFFGRFLEKAKAKASTIGGALFWGLFAFVAIPLPGTGAWTGSVIAAILKVDPKKALAAIALGVLTSGAIMGILSYGFLGFLQVMF